MWFLSLKSDLSRQNMLDISLRFIWVASQLNQWKNQTLCVIHLLCLFGKHLVFEERLKKTHRVSYFTNINFGCFMIWTVHKSYNICQLSCFVDCGNIRPLKSNLSKHTLLDFSLRFILVLSWFYHCIKQTLRVR